MANLVQQYDVGDIQDRSLAAKKFEYMDKTERARKLHSISDFLHFSWYASLPMAAGLGALAVAKTGGAGALAVLISTEGLVAAGAALLAAPFGVPFLIAAGVVVALSVASIAVKHHAHRIEQSKQFDICEINAERTADHIGKAIAQNINKDLATPCAVKEFEQNQRADGKQWSDTLPKRESAAEKGWVNNIQTVDNSTSLSRS